MYFVFRCGHTIGSVIIIIWTCILLFKLVKETVIDFLCTFCCSYMDTEQYEEAVRDYEKVYQTEKTKGENQTPLLWLSWPRFLTQMFPLYSLPVVS